MHDPAPTKQTPRGWVRSAAVAGAGVLCASIGLLMLVEPVGATAPPETTVPAPGGGEPVSAPETSPPTSTTIAASGEDTGLGPDVTVVFQTPPLITDQQVASGPLVVLPVGCPTAATATAVFVGTLELMDFRTAQFVVEQVRAGSLANWAVDGHVQVRYGEDTRLLTMGETYIIGAANDPTTGVLMSKVREPEPLFGGNAVIGADDNGVQCPTPEDPVRTLTAAGTSVESGLFTPLKDAKGDLLLAFLRPLGVAVAALIALVLVKQLAFATARSLRSVTVTEQHPHGPPERPRVTRAVRRQHRIARQHRREAEAEVRQRSLEARASAVWAEQHAEGASENAHDDPGDGSRLVGSGSGEQPLA